MRTAIRKHLVDFAGDHRPDRRSPRRGRGASSPTSGSTLPGWVPVVGKDFYEIKAELSTAQAVTPGQGQTVNIAGVEVGEISQRRARGRQGDRHAADRRRSTAASTGTRRVLLRPQDRPEGHGGRARRRARATRGRLPEGGAIPVGQTLPDVNLDEILAALDARHARRTCSCCSRDGGEGLRGTRPRAGATRSGASSRPRATCAQVNGALADAPPQHQRARSTTSRCSSSELGAKDDQLAAVRRQLERRASRRSRARTRTCAPRCASCRAR